MRAMILAAGLGTRLRPLTDDRPKALVEVAGRTLLQITLQRLYSFGIREVIVNAHHFADMVVCYLQTNGNFGMRIEVSREDVLLDTGGGLKKAAWFFLEDLQPEPFLLHNVDVLSTIDFGRLFEFHREHGALATLAVQDRKTSRYLLFDDQHQLRGRKTERTLASDPAHPSHLTRPLAFSGVHVVSPQLLPLLQEEGAFSIVDSYLRLAAGGKRILGFPADDYYWRDLGRVESVARAEEDVREQILPL